uniref:Importin N-terminal domain-containing protein n=1 Tax=Parastrongyloides trichosuri TaxID=131310 RepID=A0A0N4Z676_PARTI
MANQQLELLNELAANLYNDSNPQLKKEAEGKFIELCNAPVTVILESCRILLESDRVPYAQAVAKTVLMKTLNTKMCIPSNYRLELANYLIEYIMTKHASFPPFINKSLCQVLARIIKVSWFQLPNSSEDQTMRVRTARNGLSETYPFRKFVENAIDMVRKSASTSPTFGTPPENREQTIKVGLEILSSIIEDFGDQQGIEGVSKFRRAASDLRDNYMKDMIEIAMEILDKYSPGSTSPSLDRVTEIRNTLASNSEGQIFGGALTLSYQILSFDFIGGMYDETQDETAPIQIPAKWKDLFSYNDSNSGDDNDTTSMVDGKESKPKSIVGLFFSLYAVCPPQYIVVLLKNLVLLTSVRRTLFLSNERSCHLDALCSGALMILTNSSQLQDKDAFHEFCRLIAKVKATFQLVELVKSPYYMEMIEKLVNFTIEALRVKEFTLNSIYYLLSFWQKMVSSTAYVNSSENHNLENLCPNIVKAFVHCRLEYCISVVNDNDEDDMAEDGSLNQLMELLGTISRLAYNEVCIFLKEVFDHDYSQYESVSSTQPNSNESIILRKRLAWLINLIGGNIMGRGSLTSNSEHDVIDGDLVSRVLRLMQFTDKQHATLSGIVLDTHFVQLELAYLFCLEQVRKQYVSDQVLKVSDMYVRLTENLGIKNEEGLLVVYVRKMCTNMKFLNMNETIIQQTLSLFDELTLGFLASRKLLQIDEVKFMVNNHNGDLLSYSNGNVTLSSLKSRTSFYKSLTRIFACDLGEDFKAFKKFMAPIEVTLNEIMGVFNNPNVSCNQTQLKMAVISVCRDLTGISFALSKKIHFTMLFQWMHSNVFQFIQRALDLWGDCPEVVNPIMKLLMEISCNRTSRLSFEMSTRYTIVLFKEISKIVVNYGERILNFGGNTSHNASSSGLNISGRANKNDDAILKMKIKSITNIFHITKHVLQGTYLPYGVMKLYGDDSLKDMINLCIKLFLDVKEEIMDFPKLAKVYFSVLDTICRDQISYISQLDDKVFEDILNSIHEGIQSLENSVITYATNALDYILDMIIRKVHPSVETCTIDSEEETGTCLVALERQPDLLPSLLNTILYTLVFEESKCQWSLSRPLFGIILLQYDAFKQWGAEMIRSTIASDADGSKGGNSEVYARKKKALEAAFESLTGGIEEKVISTTNKDQFTTNVSAFRKTVQEIIRGSDDTRGGVINYTSNDRYGYEMMA